MSVRSARDTDNHAEGLTKREAQLLLPAYAEPNPDKGIAIETRGGRNRLVAADGQVVCEYTWQHLEARMLGLHGKLDAMNIKIDALTDALAQMIASYQDAAGQLEELKSYQHGIVAPTGAPIPLRQRNGSKAEA